MKVPCHEDVAGKLPVTLGSGRLLTPGLHGRLRLQRTEETTSQFASKNWMDQERKSLQAYEYLCHIGEAKEYVILKQFRGLTALADDIDGSRVSLERKFRRQLSWKKS
jgi:hypothetical protein